MSITIKLITKKLGFLSSTQPMMCTRSQVILMHRRFLTSQTLSSHIEKFPETRCTTSSYQKTTKSEDNIPNRKSTCLCFGQNVTASTSDSPRQIFQSVVLNEYNSTRELPFRKTHELQQSLQLCAKPIIGTSDDINIKENYLSFNVKNREDQSTGLKYSPSEEQKDGSSRQNLSGRPTDEQLVTVRECLANGLPNLFVKPLDYSIYHRDLLFINNIRGTQSQGILSYMKQIAILRALGHVKFAFVKFEILKITSHPEDGTVRVRWRIRGIKGYMVVWNVIRHRKWRTSDHQQEQDLWYDGFSTFFVGPDGLIHKHVADKMMPDDNPVASKAKETPLAPKLAALCVGFALSAKSSILSISQSETEETKSCDSVLA